MRVRVRVRLYGDSRLDMRRSSIKAGDTDSGIRLGSRLLKRSVCLAARIFHHLAAVPHDFAFLVSGIISVGVEVSCVLG